MVAFSIGPINVYWYGIFYLVWFLIGYFFLKFIWKTKIFAKFENLQNLLFNWTDDILIYIILWVLIWGRMWEVFIYQRHYFSHNLLEIFAIWNGGMSFVGWILGVFLSLVIFKRIKKLSMIEFRLLIDSVLVIVPLAIFFGRFGNYLNQELYWLIVPDNFWWIGEWLVGIINNLNIFHVYSHIDNNLRVNTNFISMFFEWLVLLLILLNVFLKKIKIRKIKPWIMVWYFLIFYSFFRFFIEYLRTDSQSQFIWIFTISQWIFILLIIVGLYFVFNKKLKIMNL
jgi:phosphatidylglycerol:prolipoprotein diacylglycerol transferase